MITHAWANKYWYNNHPLRWLLMPFSWIFSGVAALRRMMLKNLVQRHFPVPIIVIGNLTVGGVGKTPLVIALATAFQAKGIRVGIVSRGYGAKGPFPREVHTHDAAALVGDEPLLMVKRGACPVVIDPKRTRAIKYLLQQHQLDVILSDDGLQHYAMGRAIEIAVIDGTRGLGNGLMLPAGPLRESAKRLKSVDFIVVNGGQNSCHPREGGDPSARFHTKEWIPAFAGMTTIAEMTTDSGQWPNAHCMDLMAGEITELITGKSVKLTDLNQPIASVAGIGNPQRFYQTLTALKLKFTPYPFADHHQFTPKDFTFKEKTIVMTEKDAVKCLSFATEHMYFLPVEARLQERFWDELWAHKHLKGVGSV